MYTVYIIRSTISGSDYIGYTSNIEQRLHYHNSGLNKSTQSNRPWMLVYREEYVNKGEALKREKFLKKQRNRNFYNKLVDGV